MKNMLLVLASFLYISSAGAQELKVAGFSFQYDKMLHFAAGYIIADVVFTIQKNNDIFLPLLVPTAVGVGKELLDSVFDWKDLGSTEIGASTKVLVYFSGSGTKEYRWGSFTLEYDKMLQFAAGYFISEIVFTFQRSDDPLLPVLIPLTIAAGKELVDGYFDWKDLG
ncbi:MAG: hypothetical protein WCK36_05015, partial [Candidatus Firestonebacteria bacterium]